MLAYMLSASSKPHQYTRSLVLFLLQWDHAVHDALPAAVFVEETCEVSISRLGTATSMDLRKRSVDEFSRLYASLGPATSSFLCPFPTHNFIYGHSCVKSSLGEGTDREHVVPRF
jgi:hypothetical protein